MEVRREWTNRNSPPSIILAGDNVERAGNAEEEMCFEPMTESDRGKMPIVVFGLPSAFQFVALTLFKVAPPTTEQG